MTVDARTIAVYDAKAQDYADHFDSAGKPGAHLRRFMAALPTGGRVLDLGCGPANASRFMIEAGFDVMALDASAEMVRVAAELNGVDATLGTFDDLKEVAAFDGIWANFSLLHAPQVDLPRHLSAIARALRPGGVFHIGMKVGTGTARDGMDRRYTYVTAQGLADLLAVAGLNVTDTDTGHEVGLAGTDDPWVVMMAVNHA
ncbi:class I SAM-dependent DNA methyltransferase [Pseudooctadecabacter jejudonensis]|uniref:Cypemycin methyltransferase n=1 Tax=Pseudooctadecabacter jejudonensis TaxID=1391910 RepID=A0A1Y5S084_9RHOB|nr:class I SAM-dependent methyltransferase [Pseudooctadecabacter jejudonensis]SLN29386.1 Cypemycin methyltransferase [Pseudooctadecabacter jejudonensis]